MIFKNINSLNKDRISMADFPFAYSSNNIWQGKVANLIWTYWTRVSGKSVFYKVFKGIRMHTKVCGV